MYIPLEKILSALLNIDPAAAAIDPKYNNRRGKLTSSEVSCVIPTLV